MDNKGTLIIYPDVRWVTPKTFKDLEQNGFVYKFYDYDDSDNIDAVLNLIDRVRADSNTFDYWTAIFIPNAG